MSKLSSSNNNQLPTPTTLLGSHFEIILLTSEQQLPVCNGHYFGSLG